MAGIPDETVQEVRERTDIVDLIGRYVELRRAGQNFKGLCPFHHEKTPSFNVNPARRGYKCFGCGAKGDAIGFVMEVEGLSFPEAVRKLAELYNISVAEERPGEARRRAQRKSERDESYAITRAATELYREILERSPNGETGRQYRDKRGLSPEVCETFRIGYAPAPAEAGWDTLAKTLNEKGLSLELAEKLGLVSRSERTGAPYDRFRGRLMFPVVHPGGEVLAFSGRIVPPHDDEADGRAPPKYYNSPESLLFHKGKALFGLHAARPHIKEAGRVLIVEGNVDVVSLHQRGHRETVAPLGTALTAEQAHLIARFTTQVVMCFDGDGAGRRAAHAALPLLLDEDLDVRIVLLEPGEDPDSVDPERFDNLLAQANPALEVMMKRMAAKAGTAIDARSRALDRIAPLIARIRSETAQYMYAERASLLLSIPADRVWSAVRATKKPHLSSTSRQPVSVSAPMRRLTPPAAPLPDSQASLVALLVDVPHLATVAERAGVLDHVKDQRLAPLARAVLDGAKQGKEADQTELLGLVDPAAEDQVHRAVFSGRYRAIDGVDPTDELHQLVHRCQREAIDRQIRELDAQSELARDRGDLDTVRTLQVRKIELRSQQAELARNPTVAPEPTKTAEPAPPTGPHSELPSEMPN